MSASNPLTRLLVAGAVIVGFGAVSIRMAQSPWPGYIAALVVLAAMWVMKTRSGLNLAVERVLAVSAEYGEHSYYAAHLEEDDVAVVLTGSELLVLAEYRPDATVRLTVPLRRIEGVSAGDRHLEIRYTDQTGESRAVYLRLDHSGLDDLCRRLGH